MKINFQQKRFSLINNEGFAILIIVIAIGLIVVLGGGFLVYQKQKTEPKTQEQFSQTEAPSGQIGQLPQNKIFGNDLINHNTYITFSDDGKIWGQGALIRKSASVPDLIQLTKDIGKFKKGDLFIYFVDALTITGPGTENLGIIYSSDLGKSWQEIGHIALSGKKNQGGAVDPSLVQLTDESLRLYFFGSEITSGDSAKQTGKHKVYSARSFDGVNFAVEEGIRFEDNNLTDPEVIYFQNKWFMYYSAGPSSKLAVSPDGLNFTAAPITGGDVGGVPGALALDNGVRIFACGKEELSTAISADGLNFKLQTDIKGMGCDPAAIKLLDGRYAMIYKTVEEVAPQSQSPQQPQPQLQSQPQQLPFRPNEISVKATGSKYKTVTAKPTTGWFKTGQDADIMLSGIDFNNTGGPLLFNHPAGLASDETHLLISDRNNNRVLIWNALPTSNTPPDLVLGQPDFTSNNPGRGMHQFDWPSAVSAAKGRVVVADSYNHRVLIWLTFPTKNAEPADFVIEGEELGQNLGSGRFEWPWGVWTNGEKLVITFVHGSVALIWNNFPTNAAVKPDLMITNPAFGTPRYITSDGNRLLIWDHNAKVPTGRDLQQTGGAATFVWKSWPTANDTPYDFYFPGQAVGSFTSKGELVLTGMDEAGLKIWKIFPASANAFADLAVTAIPRGPDDGSSGGNGDILYILRGNENKVFGYLKTPTRQDQKPDFIIGSPDLNTNTLATNFFITNPVPVSDGKHLFVSSDFDRKLYVWKNLSDESSADPDWVYSFPADAAPWDNALWGNTLALAGRKTVYIWTRPPLNGEMPDRILTGKIGSVILNNLIGVALDDKYFYLSDGSNKIYVWEGVPTSSTEHKFTLTVQGPGRLDSDGKYLVGAINNNISPGEHTVGVWEVATLSGSSAPSILPTGPQGVLRFNGIGSVITKAGHLFVADTGFNRVLIWTNTPDSLAGKQPDIILGATDLRDISPEIGKNKLFWPASLAFDGSYLWVGEFKFSGRLLRFSIQP